jgi:membrane-associated phospholipid phosphatase
MAGVDFPRWTTTLTASYLAITAALIATLGATVPGRVWLVACHLSLAGALLLLNRAKPRGGMLRVIRDWHPLMLFPVLYKEVELLAPAVGDWRLTAAIPAWESALFGGQPSLYFSERLAFVPLSEYLHFCYLSYVIVIPSVAAYWYVSGRRAAFGELLLMLSTVLLGSYLFFILLPVDSPYYLSPRLGPPLAGHFFFDLVHQVSARGGARGGAFPSAHVSGAVIVSLVAWRHQRRLAYLLVPITGSVMLATVYGRFHYVLDTLAGAALAIAVVMAYRYCCGGVDHRDDGGGRAGHPLPDRLAASAPGGSRNGSIGIGPYSTSRISRCWVFVGARTTTRSPGPDFISARAKGDIQLM